MDPHAYDVPLCFFATHSSLHAIALDAIVHPILPSASHPKMNFFFFSCILHTFWTVEPFFSSSSFGVDFILFPFFSV